ncbi:MAG: hypothetical protein LBD42_05245 [Desulfovibrio sp.]|jgi:O-antigen/teichoic acid export membrane protein|nr:hypothetical protein [Desulfovibrio sp.]
MIGTRPAPRFFSGEKFLHHTASLVCGMVFAYALTALAVPVLSRLYSPEQFGAFGFFMACANMCGILAAFRYEQAIPLPAEDTAAFSLLALCLVILTATCLAVGVGGMALSGICAEVFSKKIVFDHMHYIPVFMFSMGGYNIFTQWAIRKKLFPVIAGGRVMQCGSRSLAQISLYFFSSGIFGLVVGEILGKIAGAFYCFKKSWNVFLTMRSAAHPKRIYSAAVKYRAFPLVNAPTAVIDQMQQEVPVLLFTFFTTPLLTGCYYLAEKVLMLPGMLVGQALAQVYLTRALEKFTAGGLDRDIEKFLTAMIRLALFPFCLSSLFAPDVFAFFLGEAWRMSGEMLTWLAFAFFLKFLFSPLAVVFVATQQLRLAFANSCFSLALRLGGGCLGFALFPQSYAVVALTVAMSAASLYGLHLVCKASVAKRAVIIRRCAPEILCSVAVLLAFHISGGFAVRAAILTCCCIAYSIRAGHLFFRVWKSKTHSDIG